MYLFKAEFLAWLLFYGFRNKTHPLSVPITIVDHKEDGSWKFFSGNYLTKIRITNLDVAVDNDSSIKEIETCP